MLEYRQGVHMDKPYKGRFQKFSESLSDP